MIASIPGGPAEVTSDWLSAVLSGEDSEVAIREVEVSPVGTGQTGATYRAAVSYSQRPPGLPDSFIVKLPSQEPAVRERVALGYRSEFAFYTEVADSVRLPIPRCYHCDIGNDGADFVLLLADLAPAVQGDQIAGGTVAQARLAVQALAGLHGPRWCDPAWLQFSGAAMKTTDAASAHGLADVARLATEMTLDGLGSAMTAADRDTLVAAADLVADWLLVEPDRYGLLHGDYRLDNLLFDPGDTRVTVVDWQTLAVGLPARDLAYFTGTSLVPDLRVDVERELVQNYHSALVTHGVGGYDPDDCWRDYRLGMLQVPLITTLGFAFAVATDRGDDMMLAMLERGCRAIRELETLELIRELA